MKTFMRRCHLGGVVILDDADGFLAEQLSGINSFISSGNLLPVPQVQRTAGQVQRRDVVAALMREVVLTSCQVTWITKNEVNPQKCDCL